MITNSIDQEEPEKYVPIADGSYWTVRGPTFAVVRQGKMEIHSHVIGTKYCSYDEAILAAALINSEMETGSAEADR